MFQNQVTSYHNLNYDRTNKQTDKKRLKLYLFLLGHPALHMYSELLPPFTRTQTVFIGKLNFHNKSASILKSWSSVDSGHLNLDIMLYLYLISQWVKGIVTAHCQRSDIDRFRISRFLNIQDYEVPKQIGLVCL